MKKALFVFAFILSPVSFADPLLGNSGWSTVRLGGGVTIGPAATESLPLSGPYYIRNLVIQAEGVSAASTIEVMVNGQVKGTIYAPGRDPSYVVTIAETARSIEFRYRDGGSMRVVSVIGTLARAVGKTLPWHGFSRNNGSKDQLIHLANKTLQQLERLAQFAAIHEQATYLFPIKRNAGMVYVMATSHGDFSKKTTAQLVALSDQIAFADPYLNQLMQLDQAYDAVVELLVVRETINSLLQ